MNPSAVARLLDGIEESDLEYDIPTPPPKKRRASRKPRLVPRAQYEGTAIVNDVTVQRLRGMHIVGIDVGTTNLGVVRVDADSKMPVAGGRYDLFRETSTREITPFNAPRVVDAFICKHPELFAMGSDGRSPFFVIENQSARHEDADDTEADAAGAKRFGAQPVMLAIQTVFMTRFLRCAILLAPRRANGYFYETIHPTCDRSYKVNKRDAIDVFERLVPVQARAIVRYEQEKKRDDIADAYLRARFYIQFDGKVESSEAPVGTSS